MNLTRKQRIRYIAYAIGVTIAALVILDGVIEWLHVTQRIDLNRASEQVWIVHADPWIDNEKGLWVPHPKTTRILPRSRFRKEKGEGWRGFMLGASFMMGVPYQYAGSIPYWLSTELAARYPDKPIEIVNAAQSAQSATRVGEIAGFALGHEPDLLMIATCNNEGTLAPGKVTERLHRSGAFRLLKKLLKPEKNGAPVPLHTPQDKDITAVRNAFKDSVKKMVLAARRKKVPVLLATLPVNLRYDGHESGLPLKGGKWQEPGSVPEDKCIAQGNQLLKDRKWVKAEIHFGGCKNVEAFRGIGLALYEQRRFAEAKRTLMQYVELQPRNRCRPSFNAVIRNIANQFDTVHLVDLEAMAEKNSPYGIPGPELFVDYCHMNWMGQGMVADEFLAALKQAKLMPPWQEQPTALQPRKIIYERHQNDLPPPLDD